MSRPSWKQNRIDHMISLIANGAFGDITSSRCNFYARAGDYALSKYNKRPGQGTLSQWKKIALARVTKAPTATSHTRKAPVVENEVDLPLKLRRLSAYKLGTRITKRERANVESVKGFIKFDAPTDEQVDTINNIYTRVMRRK